MGFFKFLNKKEKSMDNMEDISDLEIPPPPSSFSKNIPEVEENEPKFDFDDDFSIPYKEDSDDSFEELEDIETSKKEIPHERITDKPIYVKVDVYRDVITEMSHIKELLRRSDEGVSRINSDVNNENKEFIRWHNTLKDIQRKMLIVDKNLFKR